MAKLYIQNEEEMFEEVEVSDFVRAFVKENDVPDMTWENADGSTGSMPADEVIANLVDASIAGKELPENPALEPFQKYISDINDVVKASKGHKEEMKKQKEEEKAKKQAEKEAEKKRKEEEAAKLAKAQEIFGTGAVAGVKRAEDDFRTELEALKDGLPEGVSVNFDGNGFSVTVEEGATEETVGEALGYMMGQEQNTAAKAGVIQFLVGDIANAAFGLGLYKSMRVAGEALSKQVYEQIGKKLSPRNVESYARMARTVPPELRNPQVDATAYLAVSDAPRIKPEKLKKEEGESKEDFENRKKEEEKRSEEYEAKRLELLKSMSQGFIEVEVPDPEDEDGEKTIKEKKDLTSRKDVLPLVDDLKIAGGFKSKDEGPKMTTGDWLRRFFHASYALENFEGIHEKGKVVFHTEESETATITVEHSDLVNYLEEAKNNLVNIFFGDSLPHILEGEVEFDKKKVDKDGKIEKDKDGNPVTEKATRKVYPKFPFA